MLSPSQMAYEVVLWGRKRHESNVNGNTQQHDVDDVGSLIAGVKMSDLNRTRLFLSVGSGSSRKAAPQKVTFASSARR